MQNCAHAPPLFVTWAESFSTQKDRIWIKTLLFFLAFTEIWAKNRTNYSKFFFSDFFLFFFFFGLPSPNFGQEKVLILSGEIFLLVFIIFKFTAPPPLFRTSCVRLCL